LANAVPAGSGKDKSLKYASNTASFPDIILCYRLFSTFILCRLADKQECK
jgi:hypothetical protein